MPGVWTLVMSISLIDESLLLLSALSKEFSRSFCKNTSQFKKKGKLRKGEEI